MKQGWENLLVNKLIDEFEKIHTMLEEMKMFLFKVLVGLFLVPFGVMGLVLINL